jgi:hypothetical protein
MRLTEHDARSALDSLMAAHEADWGKLPAPSQSRYTRDAIVAAIHLWISEHGQPPTVFEAGEWPTLAVVKRQFGNMSKALFHAGVRPRRGPVRARASLLSDEDVLSAIRRWTERYGEPPAITDWSPARARAAGQDWRAERYHAGDWPSMSTVIRRFGTFTAAVKAAGLPPRPRGRHLAARCASGSSSRRTGSARRCSPPACARSPMRGRPPTRTRCAPR